MQTVTAILTAALLLGSALFPAPSSAQDPGPAGVAAADADSATGSTHDPRAVALVDRWIESVGGMDAYWALRDARYTLVTELYDPESGRLRRARPRYVTLARTEAGEVARIERWEGDDFIAHGWDGERAWARMNGEVLGPGDMDYDQATLVTSDVHYWLGLPYKLRDPGLRLHHDGTDDEGREVVRVTFGEGVGEHQDLWRYFFVEDRSWPVEVQYVEEGRTEVNRVLFRGIRTEGELVFVGRRVHVDEEGRITKILRIGDFELDPDVDPAVFSPPGASGG